MCKFGKTRLKSNLDLAALSAMTALLILASSAHFGPVPALARQAGARHTALLTVTVKNPRCPACLTTLKGYLLEMSEVKAVRLGDLRAATVNLAIDLNVQQSGGGTARADKLIALKVINRIKAHDLAVLSTKY